MRKALAICGVVAVLAIFTGSVQAGWGCGYGYGYGYQPNYYYGGYSYVAPTYYFTYGVQPSYYWHNTSHWDYHPAQVVPHGNHYHVVPGHYHWHAQGHWDPYW